jgi:UDP-N-acetylmuramate-alanine ligase
MASVAAAMQDMGFYVSGSDQNVYPPMSASLAEQRVEVMRSSKGKANPAVVGEILEKKLKG